MILPFPQAVIANVLSSLDGSKQGTAQYDFSHQCGNMVLCEPCNPNCRPRLFSTETNMKRNQDQQCSHCKRNVAYITYDLRIHAAGCWLYWRPMADPEIIKEGVDFFFLSFFLLSSQKLRERGCSRGAPWVFEVQEGLEPPQTQCCLRPCWRLRAAGSAGCWRLWAASCWQ